MHRWLYLLGLLPLSLAGCHHEEHAEHLDHGRGCDVGVSFDLSAIQGHLDKQAPATVRVCFDKSCDELTLKSDREQRWCEGAPGGPPDQLTWCNFRKDGSVRIEILRVDGQDYSDGAPHTAAITARNEDGARIYAHAEVVRFNARSCGLQKISLRPATSSERCPQDDASCNDPPPPPQRPDEDPAQPGPPPAEQTPPGETPPPAEEDPLPSDPPEDDPGQPEETPPPDEEDKQPGE
jgi:hypothetical protein